MTPVRRPLPRITLLRGLIVALAILVVLPRAQAQAPDTATADALFKEAKKLYKSGRIEEACVKFEESQRAERALGNLLNLADCYDRRGTLIDALHAFQEAEAWAVRSHDQARLEVARKRIDILQHRLASAALSQKPAPVALVASTQATPAPPDGALVSPRSEAPAAATPVVAPPLAVSATPAYAEPAPRPRLGLLDTLSIASGALALASFGVGGGVGWAAKSDLDSSRSHCTGTVCDPTGFHLVNSATRYADGATAMFAVGGVAAASAVTLAIVSAVREKRRRASTRASAISCSGFSLEGEF